MTEFQLTLLVERSAKRHARIMSNAEDSKSVERASKNLAPSMEMMLNLEQQELNLINVFCLNHQRRQCWEINFFSIFCSFYFTSKTIAVDKVYKV